MPPVSGLSVAQLGLPTSVDFGFVGEQAQQAAAAAQREDVGGQLQTRIAEESAANADFVPTINTIGFGVALVLLLINMAIMTRRRRFTRG